MSCEDGQNSCRPDLVLHALPVACLDACLCEWAPAESDLGVLARAGLLGTKQVLYDGHHPLVTALHRGRLLLYGAEPHAILLEFCSDRFKLHQDGVGGLPGAALLS